MWPSLAVGWMTGNHPIKVIAARTGPLGGNLPA
jgi:hypothetical protein